MNIPPPVSALAKRFRAVASTRYSHPLTPNPVIYMTILAKNEADVIEKNLIYHKAMGVDGFIVTDNSSDDGTREVFAKYYKKGWIKELIDEPDQDNFQVKWVERMIHLAAEKYKADWIINADADEFWVPKSGKLKTELSKTKANKLFCPIYNIIPSNETDFTQNTLMVMKPVNPQKYTLSKFNSFVPQVPKVIHRSVGFIHQHMGNHDVDMEKARTELSKDITIYHFNIRNREHFKRKMLVGGEGLEKNTELSKNIGVHMRYYYRGVQDGTLNIDEEYDTFIGKAYWEELTKKGILKQATLLKEYFNETN